MKKEKVIGAIVILIALAGGIFLKFGMKNSNSSSKNSDLTTIIQNQDTKSFLKKFPADETKSQLSEIGAKSILVDWNQNSNISLSEITPALKNGNEIAGVKNNYHIKYQEPKKWQFFKKAQLTTLDSKVIVPKQLKKASISINGKNVTYKEITQNNLFPGEYHFKVQLNKATNSQKLIVLGDGRAVHLTVPKKVKTENNEQSSTDTTTQVPETKTETETNNKVTNNDPKYVAPENLTVNDIEGTWTSYDGKNDIVGALPEKILVSGNSINVQAPHSIQYTINVDSTRYSDTDDTVYFEGDSANPFAAKLVNKTVNGEQRVVLEYLDQGMYGWYMRS